MKKYIVVIEFETARIVKKLEVTGMSEGKIERIESGMNINLDHERFYTDVLDESELD